jgi:hypothetical protein
MKRNGKTMETEGRHSTTAGFENKIVDVKYARWSAETTGRQGSCLGSAKTGESGGC